MITYILLALTLSAVAFAIVMMRRSKTMERDNRQLEAVVENQEGYTFLVNNKFEVQKTNYFVSNKHAEGEPYVLGNVLHCRNAHEAGRCGEHEACKMCPVRFVITKSFERKTDFTDVEACMELYDEKNTGTETIDVDVALKGHFVNVDEQDMMVVNVRDVTDRKLENKPKLLFISTDVVLYDKVREALGSTFRVLSADNNHQALHRLMLASSYQFGAVLTDEEFYTKNETIAQLLVKNGQVPVFVFTSNDGFADDNLICLNKTFQPKELLTELTSSSFSCFRRSRTVDRSSS